MYQSPISVFQYEMKVKMEDDCLKAVVHYGFHVEKEELVKALQYDRDQYQRGFEDGRNFCRWIPCDDELPCNPGDYIVTVKYKYSWETEWSYDVDWASSHCDNGIDCFWCCFNDWDEGNEVHVIAWSEAPAPYKE